MIYGKGEIAIQRKSLYETSKKYKCKLLVLSLFVFILNDTETKTRTHQSKIKPISTGRRHN